VADHPLRPATHRRLGEPLPHQLANGPWAAPKAEHLLLSPLGLMGYYRRFRNAIPLLRVRSHVLLTRSPLSIHLSHPKMIEMYLSFDLHVLGTPPAFILSQDQTLHPKS
jgi:hypothetical protein